MQLYWYNVSEIGNARKSHNQKRCTTTKRPSIGAISIIEEHYENCKIRAFKLRYVTDMNEIYTKECHSVNKMKLKVPTRAIYWKRSKNFEAEQGLMKGI